MEGKRQADLKHIGRGIAIEKILMGDVIDMFIDPSNGFPVVARSGTLREIEGLNTKLKMEANHAQTN